MRRLSLADILTEAVARGASDLVIMPGESPVLKVHGRWIRLVDYGILSDQLAHQLILESLPSGDSPIREKIERRIEADYSFMLEDGTRYRVNVYSALGRPCAVFRVIPNRIMSFAELGLPFEPAIHRALTRKNGLILVTGPTGSGKSTTLAAMVDWLNAHREIHIVMIEDPIEFFHTPKRAILSQREVGEDTRSFADALRAVLRQAPDVILVGEMRDLETVQTAITAAETGHLVMGTLHTNSAPETVERLVDIFPEGARNLVRSQLARTLRLVVSQMLIPRKDRQGRVLLYEIMVQTPAVQALIREGKIPQLKDAIHQGGNYGMISMSKVLERYIREKVIDPEEARGLLEGVGVEVIRP